MSRSKTYKSWKAEDERKLMEIVQAETPILGRNEAIAIAARTLDAPESTCRQKFYAIVKKTGHIQRPGTTKESVRVKIEQKKSATITVTSDEPNSLTFKISWG